jgi:hypothetical protein
VRSIVYTTGLPFLPISAFNPSDVMQSSFQM